MTAATPDDHRADERADRPTSPAAEPKAQPAAPPPPALELPAGPTGASEPPADTHRAPDHAGAASDGPPTAGESGAPDPGQFRVNEDTRADRYVGTRKAEAFLSEPAGETVGATAYGWGSQATVTVINERTPDERIYLDEITGLNNLLDRYARTRTDGWLDKIFRGGRLGVLTGDRGTGRRTTALMALLRQPGIGQVTEITLARGNDLHSLRQVAGKPEFPRAGTGYLLVQDSDTRPIPQDELQHVLGDDCVLLIVRPTDQHGFVAADRVTRHEPPDLDRVLRGHLTVELARRCVGGCEPCVRACVDTFVNRCSDETVVRDALASAYGPAEAASLAVQLSRCDNDATDADIRAAVERAWPGQRGRAERILLPGPAAGMFIDRRDGRYERAFRLAYGVFEGQPMARVFNAAQLLLVEMDRVAGCSPIGRPAFEHPVRDLLGPDMAADWTRASTVSTGTTRVAKLHDPKLVGHLLDVAWHDFDHTRPALISWLRRLGKDGRNVVRQHAALTAARLARYDFEQVLDELIEPWARSGVSAERQMAAWVVGGATGGEAVAADAAAVIQRWARSPRAYLRDTVARAYATGLTRVRLEWAMEDLGFIAQDRLQLGSSLVAEAVAAQYRDGSASRLVSALAGWLFTPAVTVRSQVARAMTLLALVHDGFLADLSRFDVSLAAMTNVWHATLHHAGSDHDAWRLFCSWLVHPRTDRSRARATVLLLARDPVLATRFAQLADPLTRHRTDTDGSFTVSTNG